MLNARGEFLNDAEGKRVLAIAASDGYTFPDVDRIGHVLDRTSYDKTHIDRVLALKLVDRDAIRAARFKVVVDAVNSVGGVVIPALLRELGVEVVELNCAPDGHFAHNPEPIPANLTEISARVPAEKADLGIVVDRCRSPGAGVRGRDDVRRGVYAGRRGRLRAVAYERGYRVEPEFVAGFARRDRTARLPVLRRCGRRSERRDEDERGRRGDRR